MQYKYVESDFAVLVKFGATYLDSTGNSQGISTYVPFNLNFYTPRNGNVENSYLASYDGNVTKNCTIIDGSSVLVYFDRTQHKFAVGELMLEAEWILSDAHYEGDNTNNVKRLYSTGITLTKQPDQDTEGEITIHTYEVTIADSVKALAKEHVDEVLGNINDALEAARQSLISAESAQLSAVSAQQSASNAEHYAETVKSTLENLTGSEDPGAAVLAQVAQNTAALGELGPKIEKCAKVDLSSTNILLGLTPEEKWFVSPTDGNGQKLGDFFSFVDIPCEQYQNQRLFAYGEASSNNAYRSFVFYASDGTFSKVDASASASTIGVAVPANAVKMSISYKYKVTSTQEKGIYYLSTTKDVVTEKILDKDVVLDYRQIENTPVIPDSVSQLSDANQYAKKSETLTTAFIYTNLLRGLDVEENTFVDPSLDGKDRPLNNFFSYIYIPCEQYRGKRLYPYGEGSTYNVYRSFVVFDANKVYIQAFNADSSRYENGIQIPDNASYLSICFVGKSAEKEHYLSYEKGNPVYKRLDSDVEIPYEKIVDAPKYKTINGESIIGEGNINVASNSVGAIEVQPLRLPTFAFIFDDGTNGDVNVKALFDSYGMKCGFALLSTNNNQRYLDWQNEGFEILSHSVNGTAFNSIDDVDTADSYLRDSAIALKAKGFNITGWVTPSSWLKAEQMASVKKYYQYGFGHLTGNPEGVNIHTFKGLDIRQLDRWGLESKTLEQTLQQIDNCVAQGGFMCFYGHSYPSTSNQLTEANMKAILDKLSELMSQGKAYVLTPRDAINNYYQIRWSDFKELMA